MSMAKASRSPSRARILFPWERRGGLRSLLPLGRLRLVLSVGAGLAFIVLIGVREHRRAGIRQTRATLTSVRGALDAYRADNDGGCPPSLDKVESYGNFKQLPTDAWGHPFRLTCPARHDGSAYELMSDGPDGEPGGLDRVE